MSRIRANQITNQSADGAPTVQNGLVISGVTTSTTFSGSGASLTNLPSAQLTGALPALDGSNLTGITQTTINNNADNRIITGSGSANTLEGESGLTYSSNTLDVNNAVKLPDDGTVHFGVSDTAYVRGKDSTDGYVKIGTVGAEVAIFTPEKTIRTNQCPALETTAGAINITGGTSGGRIALQGTTTSADSGIAEIFAFWGTNKVAGIMAKSGSDTSNKDDGALTFFTSSSGPAVTERVQIKPGGGLVSSKGGSIAFSDGYSAIEARAPEGTTQLTVTNTTYESGTFDNEAGIWFKGNYSGNNERAKSAIIHKNTGDYGVGDLYFCIDDSADNNNASINDVKMKISKDGQVTKPAQASFAAVNTNNGYSLNGQVFPFNETVHNIGSHFNTSNYRFTAPVAGRYLFTFYSIYNSSGQGRYEILINGAADQKGTRVHMNNNNTNWDNTATTWILNLAANDYIQMYSHTNTGWHGNHWQRFCGELLS